MSIFAIQDREINGVLLLERPEVPMNNGTACRRDRVPDEQDSHGIKKPRSGVWLTLFEPVYTGGHPIRALGGL